jgi:hypothetical protein
MDKKIASIHPRKLARSMAKANLNERHVTGYNKERKSATGMKIPSIFARNWKELAVEASKPRNKKGVRK